MCDGERQSGSEYLICFQQNVGEADKFLLILSIYIWVKSLFFSHNKVGNCSQLLK